MGTVVGKASGTLGRVAEEASFLGGGGKGDPISLGRLQAFKLASCS